MGRGKGKGKSSVAAPQAKRKRKKQLSVVEKFEEQRKLFLSAKDKDKFIDDYLLSLADNKHIVKGYSFFHNYAGLEVNYYSDYSCESSGCDEEGICRCGQIDLDSISFKIKNEKDLKDSLASHFVEQLDVLPDDQEKANNFFLMGQIK